ncbi:hypothetical protein Ccrd_020219 [Cynara cardunculus var. scolymus]|uniref:Uncharacterized protein n=1 Tax=Cynara cardunculus var. scolymus TaxID=59895 RepID=A0A103Y2V9_CYNCS|nr:hypothetical protein Ccrd_020219 [Cynara cardunculus var. scolymus]
MHPKDIMKLTQNSGDAGFNSKLSFLVLFVNLVVECSRMGCCNFGFLSRIENEDMISEIDWCKYIYGKNKNKKRYSMEIKDEGFGLLPLRSTLESSQDIQPYNASNQQNVGETSTPTKPNKEVKRSYADVTPLKFGLGLSPIKQPKPVSMVRREDMEGHSLTRKGKGIEISSPMKRCNVEAFDNANEQKLKRVTRRELKLGDHLRSPYVIKAVDMNVFFPLLDKGHYYLVVFNLKNPSIVVIDNRYREVSDDDHILQMYDFITDILVND